MIETTAVSDLVTALNDSLKDSLTTSTKGTKERNRNQPHFATHESV